MNYIYYFYFGANIYCSACVLLFLLSCSPPEVEYAQSQENASFNSILSRTVLGDHGKAGLFVLPPLELG